MEILKWPVDYMILAREVGESGTPHLQGYARFTKKKRLTALKKLLREAHFEVAKGTPQQNYDYCSKDGDFEEVGTLPKTGGQTIQEKYSIARKAMLAGDRDSIPDDIYMRHGFFIEKMISKIPKYVPSLEYFPGVWIHGPAGCGKSTLARSMIPEERIYFKQMTKWWDGYENQELVILDDIDVDHTYMRRHLKIWCDRFSFNAEIKGSSMMIRPKCIIITSQYRIDQIFPDQETRDALERRCKVIDFNLRCYDKCDRSILPCNIE